MVAATSGKPALSGSDPGTPVVRDTIHTATIAELTSAAISSHSRSGRARKANAPARASWTHPAVRKNMPWLNASSRCVGA